MAEKQKFAQEMPVAKLAEKLGRSVYAVYRLKKDGCPGFHKRRGKIVGDLKAIRSWLKTRDKSKPGPAGRRAKKPAGESRPSRPLLDPALVKAIDESEKGIGDGPLELELSRCRALFDRLSKMALAWDEANASDPEQLKDFLDIVRGVGQLAAKISGVEKQLLDVAVKHGELIPADDVRGLLRGLSDQVIKSSDELIDRFLVRARECSREIEADRLRAGLIVDVEDWRRRLAARAGQMKEAS